MAKSQLYAGASKPGDFEKAREEVAEMEASQARKRNLPTANPVSERSLTVPLSFLAETSILQKHW